MYTSGRFDPFVIRCDIFYYYFICIILFCFHIVFLMTINTFELKIELNIMIKNVSFVFVSDTPIRPTQIGLDMK